MKTVLPNHITRLVSPEDRKKLGLETAEETLAKGEAKSEKALQRQIVNLLRLKGIEPIVSRMDRPTSNNAGTPDILFSLHSVACAWEVKVPKFPLNSQYAFSQLSEQQIAMREKLISLPSCWRWRLITSVEMALAELKEMGL